MPKFKMFIETLPDSRIGPEEIADLIADNYLEVIDIQWEDDREEDDGKDHFLN